MPFQYIFISYAKSLPFLYGIYQRKISAALIHLTLTHSYHHNSNATNVYPYIGLSSITLLPSILPQLLTNLIFEYSLSSVIIGYSMVSAKRLKTATAILLLSPLHIIYVSGHPSINAGSFLPDIHSIPSFNTFCCKYPRYNPLSFRSAIVSKQYTKNLLPSAFSYVYLLNYFREGIVIPMP